MIVFYLSIGTYLDHLRTTVVYTSVRIFFSVDASKGIEVAGIVVEMENGSVSLKCPVCYNKQTCNPSE